MVDPILGLSKEPLADDPAGFRDSDWWRQHRRLIAAVYEPHSGLSFPRDQFGAELRRRRVALGMTQEDLAAHLGCWNTLVSKWETDVCMPGQALRVRVIELLEDLEARRQVA